MFAKRGKFKEIATKAKKICSKTSQMCVEGDKTISQWIIQKKLGKETGGQRDVVDRKLFLSGGADILFVPFSLPFIRPEEIRFYHKPLSFPLHPAVASFHFFPTDSALCYVINNKKEYRMESPRKKRGGGHVRPTTILPAKPAYHYIRFCLT